MAFVVARPSAAPSRQRAALSSAPQVQIPANRDSLRSRHAPPPDMAKGKEKPANPPPAAQPKGAKGGKLTENYELPPEWVKRPAGSGGMLRRLELLGE
ncbi:hypothetical protein BT69DRAFT_1339903, partial [Atractiella rhizophila]